MRKKRSDQSKSRMPEDMKRLVEALYLAKPRRSIAAIHREATEVAARQGWPPPGYEQVRAVVGALSPSLISMAHEGTDAYRQAYDLLHRREASHPNEIWQADHTQLDVWLKSDRGGKLDFSHHAA